MIIDSPCFQLEALQMQRATESQIRLSSTSESRNMAESWRAEQKARQKAEAAVNAGVNELAKVKAQLEVALNRAAVAERGLAASEAVLKTKGAVEWEVCAVVC